MVKSDDRQETILCNPEEERQSTRGEDDCFLDSSKPSCN